MKLKYFDNIGDGNYSMNLQGVFSIIEDEDIRTIDGFALADEIDFLNSIGANKITENINSIGGHIMSGFAVVSANLRSKAIIETVNVGVADSTAGWVLASGDNGHRKTFDFGSGVVHNPSIAGTSLEEMEEGKEKDELMTIKNSVVKIFTNNSGMSEKEVSDLMDKDERLSATKMKQLGIVDEIIKSKKSPKLTENLTALEMMNVCSEHKEPINTLQMKDVTNRLKLQEGASETQHVQAIEAIENRASKAEGEVTSLKAENQSKDEEITALNSEVDKYKNEAIVASVNSAIEAGKFDKEKKEDLTNMAKSMGVENFNKMVELQKVTPVNVVDLLNQGDGTEPKLKVDDKLAAEYEDLATNNSSELERIKNQEPARFEKMLNAWNK